LYEIIFIPLVIILLVIMSIHDINNHSIKIKYLFVLWFISSIYALVSLHDIISIGSLLYLVMIFGVMFFFRKKGFGSGDFYTLTGLWPFFQPIDSLWSFLILFIIIWMLVVIFIIFKPGTTTIEIKEYLFKKSIPLIPVITTAFFIWSLIFLYWFLIYVCCFFVCRSLKIVNYANY